MRTVFVSALTLGVLFCAVQVIAQRNVLRDFKKTLVAQEQVGAEVKQLKLEVEQLRARLSHSASAHSEPELPSGPDVAIKPATFIAGGAHRDDPFIGSKDSPLLFMAFLDFQCTPCRAFVKDTFPTLKTSFFDRGTVRFLVRDFALDSKPHSITASSFAHCAGEQGAYWKAFDLLYSEDAQPIVDKGEFSTLAQRLEGVDRKRLLRCTNSSRYRQEIVDDKAEGTSLGAKGAPGFFLGRQEGEDRYSGVLVRGAQPYAIFAQQLSRLGVSQ